MSIALASAGTKFSYAVETVAGTKPTTFTQIKDIVSIPAFDSAPSTYDVTTLDNTEYKTYISGLKDLGGALQLTANLSQDFLTNWNTTLMTAYETAAETDKETWFCVDIKGLDKSIFFKGEPSSLGIPEINTDSALTCSAYIVPTSEPTWDTDPTYA